MKQFSVEKAIRAAGQRRDKEVLAVVCELQLRHQVYWHSNYFALYTSVQSIRYVAHSDR